MKKTLQIGISSCLLGAKVRYDGGDKEDRFLTKTLGQYVEWVPVCPEVEAGLGEIFGLGKHGDSPEVG